MTRNKKPEIFTGLDVGTTKICCIIGRKDEGGNGVRILGVGTHPSEGLKEGIVNDIEKTVDAIRNAVFKARQIASLDCGAVYVGIAGDHITCMDTYAEISVSNPERGVSEPERDRVIEKARPTNLLPGIEPIQVIPQEFICDGQGGVKDPVRVRCQTLGVRLHVIAASVAAAQNIIHCVNRAGLKTSSVVLQSLASSVAVLDEEVKDLGCALIDIGGGTTDISVFREGSIRYSGVIPEGGDSITRAVADGLGTPFLEAENLKKRFGHALSHVVDPEETFEAQMALNKTRVSVKRVVLSGIIERRMGEILTKTRAVLAEKNLMEHLHAGVVLTGGASLTEGARELAERVFERPVRIGMPEGLKGLSGPVSSPIYATGVGLVEYGMVHGPLLNAGRRPFDRVRRFLGKIFEYY